jgi:hypothetical protein
MSLPHLLPRPLPRARPEAAYYVCLISLGPPMVGPPLPLPLGMSGLEAFWSATSYSAARSAAYIAKFFFIASSASCFVADVSVRTMNYLES